MSGRLFALGLVLVVLAHVALCWHFVPPSVVFSSTPIAGSDYDTHAEQVMRVLEGFEQFGKSWVYDVKLLAGSPTGTIFDADNKAWELFTYALHRAGVPPGLGFNLFVLLVFMLQPACTALSALALGLPRPTILIATALGSCLWFFDSLLHWLWFVGTLAFLLGSCLSVLALGLFSRWGAAISGGRVLALGAVLSVGHLVHPYMFFVLSAPMLLLYLRRRGELRELAVLRHVQLLAVIASVLAVNAYWLWPAIRHWHYILDSAYLMSAHPSALFTDFLELVIDTETTGGIATRTAFRTLTFGLAAVGIWLLGRERGGRGERSRAFEPLAAALVWLLGLAYLGALLLPLRQIQPYRFIVPAMLVAVHPAAYALQHIVVELRASMRAAGRSPLLVAALGVAGVLLVQHLAVEVLFFFPGLLPRVTPPRGEAHASFSATGFPLQPDYRIAGPDSSSAELAAFLDQHKNEGRVAVQRPDLGERMSWASGAQILGGFVYVNLQHGHSNPFRRLLDARSELPASALREHLEAYAVRYVVLDSPEPRLEDAGLLELVTHFGLHRVFRTTLPVSWFAQGGGRLRAQTNRLIVWDTDPTQDLVLRFHFHEALICDPACTLTSAPNPTGGVPFIRVPAPHPAGFLVDNRYGKW